MPQMAPMYWFLFMLLVFIYFNVFMSQLYYVYVFSMQFNSKGWMSKMSHSELIKL